MSPPVPKASSHRALSCVVTAFLHPAIHARPGVTDGEAVNGLAVAFGVPRLAITVARSRRCRDKEGQEKSALENGHDELLLLL
jgi:hypothetical protein